jgi:hypothetical protein
MKRSSLTAKLLKARQAARTGSPEAVPGPGRARIRSWSLVLLCIMLTAGVSYAVFHFFVLSRIPYQLVGTWVVLEVKSKGVANPDESLKGGRLEFRRDGTMIGTVNMDHKEGTIKATVEHEGATLRITSVNPLTGQAVTDVQTIRTLEGDRFVIEDRNGTVLTMERLRE